MLGVSNDSPPPPESNFCIGEAYIAVTGATLEVGYNVAFMYHIFQTARQGTKIKTKWYHILVCTLLVGILVKQSGLVGHRGFGRSQYGSCSVHYLGGMSLAFGFTTMVLIVFLSSYIIIQIKKIVPKEFEKTKQLKELKRNFVNFYQTYLQLVILLWSIVLVNFLIQFAGTSKVEGESWDETRGKIIANVPLDPRDFPIHYSLKGIIYLIGKLGNISKALTPILLFYLRIRDPLLK